MTVAQVRELGPLTMRQTAHGVVFTLSEPGDIALELPTDYEQVLARQLAELAGAPGVAVDLHGIPAISSRQLGVLIALQKALRTQTPRLPLLGVAPAVKRLLDISQTAQFFELR